MYKKIIVTLFSHYLATMSNASSIHVSFSSKAGQNISTESPQRPSFVPMTKVLYSFVIKVVMKDYNAFFRFTDFAQFQ